VEAERPNGAMMRGRMMLGEVIREIVFAATPADVELALTDAIAHPMAAHVHCLGASLLDGVVGDALCGVIVGANGSWSLFMAEFFKRVVQWHCVFAVVAKAAAFGFRSRTDDLSHDVGRCENWSVVRGRWIRRQRRLAGIGRAIAETEMSSATRSGLGLRKAGGIAVDPKTHVGPMEAKNGIRMTGRVVEQLNNGIERGFGSVGLGSSN